MAVDAPPHGLAKPEVEFLEKVGKAVKDTVGAGGLAVFVIALGKAALHVKPWPPPRPPLHRARKKPVDLRRRRFRPRGLAQILAKEGGIEPFRMGPDLAGDKTVRPAQKL